MKYDTINNAHIVGLLRQNGQTVGTIQKIWITTGHRLSHHWFEDEYIYQYANNGMITHPIESFSSLRECIVSAKNSIANENWR